MPGPVWVGALSAGPGGLPRLPRRVRRSSRPAPGLGCLPRPADGGCGPALPRFLRGRLASPRRASPVPLPPLPPLGGWAFARPPARVTGAHWRGWSASWGGRPLSGWPASLCCRPCFLTAVDAVAPRCSAVALLPPRPSPALGRMPSFFFSSRFNAPRPLGGIRGAVRSLPWDAAAPRLPGFGSVARHCRRCRLLFALPAHWGGCM